MIEGEWHWQLGRGDNSRTDSGHFKMYRGYDGRQLNLRMDDYLRIYRSPGRERRHEVPFQWTFLKASSRLVLWGELPF